MVEISDPEISKCTIDDLIDEQPPFVVVSCCGENLGEENSRINQLLVGTQTRLLIFKLKEKSLMDEGHLRKLLLDSKIKKVNMFGTFLCKNIITIVNILSEMLWSCLLGKKMIVEK